MIRIMLADGGPLVIEYDGADGQEVDARPASGQSTRLVKVDTTIADRRDLARALRMPDWSADEPPTVRAIVDAIGALHEGDYAERDKMARALGMSAPDRKDPGTWPLTWRALRAQARRARDLGGEAFVTALRNALAECGPGVADMTRPELLGMVRRLVSGREGAAGTLRARLLRELDPTLHANLDALERAYLALAGMPGEPLTELDWANISGSAQERNVQVATDIIRAYLDGAAGE